MSDLESCSSNMSTDMRGRKTARKKPSIGGYLGTGTILTPTSNFQVPRRSASFVVRVKATCS